MGQNWTNFLKRIERVLTWIDKYVGSYVGSDCRASVFGMHVAVCASARVCPLPWGLLPSQQEAKYSFSGFIPTNIQTNKTTTTVQEGFITKTNK